MKFLSNDFGYRVLKKCQQMSHGTISLTVFPNIKMGLLEIGWDGVHWIGIAQDRDKWRAPVNVVKNLPTPKNFGKLSSGYIIM
jgi:hypothetical protein